VREPRPIPGAKTPLFERLLDDRTVIRQPLSSSRAMDLSTLRESVCNDLSRLLNSRSNLRGGVRELAQGTVLDYGVPAFPPVSAASDTQRESLAKILEGVISGFEPRLKNVKVVIQQDRRNPQSLLGAIYANLVLGTVMEPVYFPLAISESGKKIDIGGS
jgi:type VI secretion system lysozyme-like protein